MSKIKRKHLPVEVINGSDAQDVRLKFKKTELVEISSAEEKSDSEVSNDEEDEDNGEKDQLQSEGIERVSETLELSPYKDLQNTQKLSKHNRGVVDHDPDVGEIAGDLQEYSGHLAEPSFGDIIRANGPDLISVEDVFKGQGTQSSSQHKLQPYALSNNNSLGTVLTQALRTNDLDLLNTCLSVKDLSVIRATVERLESQHATTLLRKLAERLHRRPGRAGSLIVWIQWTIVAHGGYLAAQPDLMKKTAALQKVLQERARALQPLLALKGKLDMIEAQLELRRNLQHGSKPDARDADDEERVLYVEGEEDEQGQEAVKAIKDKEPVSNGLGSSATSHDTKFNLKDVEGGIVEHGGDIVTDELVEKGDYFSDSDNLIDEEAEETENDSSDELDDDSVDHDDVSLDDDDVDDEDESEIEPPPAKRIAASSRQHSKSQKTR